MRMVDVTKFYSRNRFPYYCWKPLLPHKHIEFGHSALVKPNYVGEDASMHVWSGVKFALFPLAGNFVFVPGYGQAITLLMVFLWESIFDV